MIMSIRIFIADDHQLFRDGLHQIIEHHPNMTIVGEAGDGQTVIRELRENDVDVVLMDISMPDLNGIETTREILRENAKIKILALSMYSDRRRVSEMLRAGASGYLIKEAAAEELTEAITAISRNLTYLSPAIAGGVVEDHVRHQVPATDNSAYNVLSAREREVLQLISEGKSTKEIADKLFVSNKTIETHRRNIMERLELHSIAELTKYAVREGLTVIE
jgi:DNA-binding NarL/FixJ family response regulator